MPRRKSPILDLLVTLPWWVNLLLAATVYFVMTSWAPRIAFENPVYQGFVRAAPALALPFSGILLLVALVSAFKAWQRGTLLKQQTGLDSLRNTGWQDFERLVGEAFRRQGYKVIETGGGGADGGIDLRLKKDGVVWLVQCKRWRHKKIGVKVVRELYGVVTAESAAGGILVTTSDFTPDAVDFASGMPLELIAGDRLWQMISEVKEKAESATKRDVATEPVVAPESCSAVSSVSSQPVAIEETPACPRCGSQMVRRTAGKGPNAGHAFWGCSGFPACKGVRSV